MKVTMYELIGLIKDGKAPKKIRYNNEIWEYGDELKTYDNVDYFENLLEKLFRELYILDFINNEVEIIEEPKKIEKLPYYSLEKIQKSKNKDEWYENRLELLEKRINDYHNKINESIDEINNLKEKKEEQED